MSVDAVTYSKAEWLTMTYGFVVRIGETIAGKEFSNRILSVFDRDLVHAKCASYVARKNAVSIWKSCRMPRSWRWLCQVGGKYGREMPYWLGFMGV